MSENYYKVLGIDENASKDEIKKAYRSLSFKYHPDKNNNSPESVSMTQKLNEAYETLSDEQKKNEYDTRNDPKNPFIRMSSFRNPNEMPFNPADINNIFSQMFANPFGMPIPPGVNVHMFRNGVPINMNVNPNFAGNLQKPSPIIKTLEVTMEQVMNGGNLPVEIERWIMESGNKIFEYENLYINIPKGIDDNEIIIIRDKGNIVSDELKGDVKIFIKIKNTTDFKRQGLDLIYEKNISFKESLCGFSFELKHLNDKTYTLKNATGNIVTPGYKKIIPQMGLQRENHIGNLIVIFNIQYPETLTEEQVNKLKDIL
jgi:DnaJ-class molecular chaperone